MKRTKIARVFMMLVFTGMVGMMAQSCNSSKKCGCGTDINGVYKRRHGWFSRG